MITNLFEILIRKAGVSDTVLAEVLPFFSNINIKKDSLILQLGQTATHFYFIDSGLIRAYINDEEGEQTTWLVAEGEFIASAESFFEQQPAFENIQALEDCVLWRIAYDDLRYLQRQFDDIKSFSLHLTETQVAEYSRRMRLIMSRPIQKRYDLFSASHPHLIGRVNQAYLASYLGMSRGSFSLIQSNAYKQSKKLSEK
jgi:CRP/FNR family transcriptional regulator, anaerobic regulatory protein